MVKKVKVLILRTAGTNCDKETGNAFKTLGADIHFAHINKLLNKEINMHNYHILVLSGGFSYGDYISAGKILGNQIKFNLYNQITDFVKCGKLVLGICNGFQVLVKCGLLPGWNNNTQKFSLLFNDSDKFECRWVYLKKGNIKSPFLTHVPDIIRLPIAHAEGKFISPSTLEINKLEKTKQVAFKYVDQNGNFGKYPINPNGSINHIAGICNTNGNILGLMPHPERFLSWYQDPHWTSNKKITNKYGDGYYIFKSAIKYIKSKI